MKTIRCPQCNLADWDNVIICKRCKYEFQTAGQTEVAEEPLESPFQRQGSEFQRQEVFEEPVYEPEMPQPQAPPLYEERFDQNYAQSNNYQPAYSYSNPTHKPKIKMAVISMILGILGMPFVSMFWGALLAIVLALVLGVPGAVIGGVLALLIIPSGLVLGIVSLVKSNRRPTEYGGKGFAIAGIICSGLGVLTLPMIAAIAIPNLLAARRAANEGSAIVSLRKIAVAEEMYRDSNSGYCGDLSELGNKQMIDSVLAKGEKSGYSFLIVNLPTAKGGCEITATPLSASVGNRSFYFSTEEGIIRAASKNGELGNQTDPPLEGDFEQQPPKIASSDNLKR